MHSEYNSYANVHECTVQIHSKLLILLIVTRFFSKYIITGRSYASWIYFRHGYKSKESSCSSYCPGKFCPHIISFFHQTLSSCSFNFYYKYIISRSQVACFGRYLSLDWFIFIIQVNGGWSDYKSWSSWSSCDKSCGTGTKTRGRTRSCDNPAPKHNGKTCPGSASNTESVSCKLRECPSKSNPIIIQ